MVFPDSHITLVIIVAACLSAAIAAWRWRQSKVVRRRITRMMLTFGIDGETARGAEALLDIDMNAVRRRCRRCPSPATCERWLNGETVPGSDFCPNAPEFAAVVQARQCRLRYAPGHRPGRRLDG
jgi:hypothetical protein